MTTIKPELTADHFALLNNLSQSFNLSLDLGEVLNRVMDEVIAATRAERGFVTLRGEDGELDFSIARGALHGSKPQHCAHHSLDQAGSPVEGTRKANCLICAPSTSEESLKKLPDGFLFQKSS